MKNRKNILITFAVIAFLCMGIGFAALTDNLQINGTINGNSNNNSSVVNPELFDLQWTGTPTATPELPAGEDETTYNNLFAKASYDATNAAQNAASINVQNMSIKGQTVTATFTIKNASAEAYMALVTAKITTIDNTSLTCTYEFIDDNNVTSTADDDGQSVVIKQNGTVQLKVTIVMNETLTSVRPTNPDELSETIKVVITGEHVDDYFVDSGMIGGYEPWA